jgi:transmembrane sensor
MSDLPGEKTATSNAKDIAGQAADWIQRRAFWAWTEHEDARLDAWLAESLAHRIAYARAEAAWNRTARVTALRSSEPAAQAAKQGWISLKWLHAAVALVVVTAMGIGAQRYFNTPPEIIYATSIGEHKTVTLSDGSQIELNTGTILKTSNSGPRLVRLVKGEAFFTVKHNSVNPLTVIAENHRVTDLGTKFLIRSEPNRLEVALVEGRAAFGAANTSTEPPIVLMPGDSLLVADNQIRTTRKSAQTLADELGWRHGMLIFENASLVTVAEEINRYNTRKIVVVDQAVARMRISASFPATGVEDFAQLARQLLGLKVDRYNDRFIISR